MFKTKIIYLLSCLAFFGVLSSCEQGGFSEEELQGLSQSSNLTINVEIAGSNDVAEGVTVSLEGSEDVVETVTDENGVAFFTDVPNGSLIIRLSGEGYFEAVYNEEILPDNRTATRSLNFEVYSVEEAATVKGKVLIQTDLTTEEYEHPEGLKVDVLQNNKVVASGITDAEGNFVIEVPTTEDGEYFTFYIPQPTYDQQLYVLEDGAPVLKTAIGTKFMIDAEAEAVPNTSNIQVEISDPYYSSGRQAYAGALEVVGGQITDIEIEEIGYGYGSWQTIAFNITSESGSGASISVDAGYDNSICGFPDYYVIRRNTLSIDNGGLNYPEYRANENVTTEHPQFIWEGSECRSVNDSFIIESREVLEMKLNYGTGTDNALIQTY